MKKKIPQAFKNCKQCSTLPLIALFFLFLPTVLDWVLLNFVLCMCIRGRLILVILKSTKLHGINRFFNLQFRYLKFEEPCEFFKSIEIHAPYMILPSVGGRISFRFSNISMSLNEVYRACRVKLKHPQISENISYTQYDQNKTSSNVYYLPTWIWYIKIHKCSMYYYSDALPRLLTILQRTNKTPGGFYSVYTSMSSCLAITASVQ